MMQVFTYPKLKTPCIFLLFNVVNEFLNKFTFITKVTTLFSLLGPFKGRNLIDYFLKVNFFLHKSSEMS